MEDMIFLASPDVERRLIKLAKSFPFSLAEVQRFYLNIYLDQPCSQVEAMDQLEKDMEENYKGSLWEFAKARDKFIRVVLRELRVEWILDKLGRRLKGKWRDA
jgi:hypothetical protein